MKNAECGSAPLSQAQVQAKHHYRFKYLKSEHWSNLRIAKLASVDAKCRFCKTRDLSNDVHHLRYRSLYDVQLEDLVVLCRTCHDRTHLVLDLFRNRIKKSENVWKETKRFLMMATRCEELGMDFSIFGAVPENRVVNVFWKMIKAKRKGADIPIETALIRKPSPERPEWEMSAVNDRRYIQIEEYVPYKNPHEHDDIQRQIGRMYRDMWKEEGIKVVLHILFDENGQMVQK